MNDLAKLASHNAEAEVTTLGKWHPDMTSYEQVAFEKGHAYYDLGSDGWNAAESLLKENGLCEAQIKDEMWRVNEKYLDDRIRTNSSFEFTSNPSNLKGNTYGAWKHEHLLDKGYLLKQFGDIWRMIK